MKIKKLWLVVLTLAFMCMFTMVAFADDTDFYTENYIRAHGDAEKVYIELPTDTGGQVSNGAIDKAIDEGKGVNGPIKDTTEIEIVILSDNYRYGLTSGMIQEGALSSKYKDRITSMSITGFSTIYIPKLVAECPNLKSLTIADTVTVTQINPSAFSGCTGLESIVIPKGVETIGDDAFYGCKNLQSIVIPDGVETIGNEAFSGCERLTSIVIPDGVTTIGKNAFYDCESLESIVIPESVTSIGEGAFLHCKNLTNIVNYTADDSTVIDYSCFYDAGNEACFFYDEDEGDYIDYYYEDDEDADYIDEFIQGITKEITVANSDGSSDDSGVGVVIEELESDGISQESNEEQPDYVTFNLAIETDMFGGDGDGQAKYLDSVYVSIVDATSGTVYTTEKVNLCYEENGKLIFPVKIPKEDVENCYVRGEICARTRMQADSTEMYYATSVITFDNATTATDAEETGESAENVETAA